MTRDNGKRRPAEPSGRPLRLTPAETIPLNRIITSHSHENFNRCLQCRTCAAACPFSSAMDIKPNQVLRMAQLGLAERLLHSSTIWICVGCHTCTSFCPMAINIPAVMDALRALSRERGIEPAEPNILNFHRQVIDSIHRHGRTHKLGVMMRYKLTSGELLSDVDAGLRMLKKGKLELLPSTVNNLKQVQGLFEEPGK
jgi:heterodisulfide reductase subunit C